MVRHGETQLNVEDRYGGKLDVPLTDKGIKQAEELVLRLEEYTFTKVLCSPLIRAKQTAEIIVSHRMVPLQILSDLSERSFGVYEGLTKQEISMKYPELFAINCTHLLNQAPYNGESLLEFENRIKKVLTLIVTSYTDENILVVTHGFVAMMINKIVNNVSFDEMFSFHLGNCEILKITI